MIKKLRRWQKITIIITGSIICLVIIANLSLNFFLRRSVEKSLNGMINAEVKIEKLRINFFSGKIKIINFSIIGTGTFENDTLLFSEQIFVKPKSFDRKTQALVLEEIFISNANFKNIVAENGKSCWESIQKKSSKSNDTITDGGFDFFVDKLTIQNLNIYNINRQKQTTDIYSEINLNLLLNKNAEDIVAEFELSLKASNEYVTDKKFGLYGILDFTENSILGNSVFLINEFPVDIEIELNTDSLKTAKSFIRLKADFSKLKTDSHTKAQGDLKLYVESFGVFAKDYDFNFSAHIVADSVVMVNLNENIGIVANFNTILDYYYSDVRQIGISSNNMLIQTGENNLAGSMFMGINDTCVYAESDLRGSFDSNVLNRIFAENVFNNTIKVDAQSDISGIIDENSNKIAGLFTAGISVETKDYGLGLIDIIFDKEAFGLNLIYNSDFAEIYAEYRLTEIKNIFTESLTKQFFDVLVKRISLPTSGGIGAMKFAGAGAQATQISFPKSTETKIVFLAENIISGNIVYNDLGFSALLNPDKIEFSKIKAEIGDAYLSGDYAICKEGLNTVSKINLSLTDLDLSFFANDSLNIEGIVNFKMNNTIYSNSDSISYIKNSGTNSLILNKFKLKTDLLRNYEIDEDYINIDNLDLSADIAADIIRVKSNGFKINDALLNLGGNYDLLNDTIDLSILMDIPNKYISSKVKIAIAMFSEGADKGLPKSKDRTSYLLKIEGSTTKPKYRIFR